MRSGKSASPSSASSSDSVSIRQITAAGRSQGSAGSRSATPRVGSGDDWAAAGVPAPAGRSDRLGLVPSPASASMEDRTAERSAAVSEIDNRLFFRFFQAANTLHTKGTQALEPLGVTTQQWSVLGALSRPQVAQGMTVNELSSYLLVSRQNLSGILNRLEAEDYLVRVPDERDARSRRVRLTPRGEQLWTQLAPLIEHFYRRALEGFSFDDRVSFLGFVNKLQRNMSSL